MGEDGVGEVHGVLGLFQERGHLFDRGIVPNGVRGGVFLGQRGLDRGFLRLPVQRCVRELDDEIVHGGRSATGSAAAAAAARRREGAGPRLGKAPVAQNRLGKARYM